MRKLIGYSLIAMGFEMSYLFLFVANSLASISLLAFIVFWILMPLVRWPFFFGKRLVARRANEVLVADLRAPVLLLRSFADDKRQVKTMSSWGRFLLFRYFVWDYSTLEEMLIRVFSTCGPVVAIGRPGEIVPPLGAAREWIRSEEWQQRVEELLRKSRLVVLIIGPPQANAGLAWEIQKIFELGVYDKVVFIVPPLSKAKLLPRWQAIVELTLGRIPSFEGNELAVRFSHDGSAIIYRGSGKRWERDYMKALLPLSSIWATRRNKTTLEGIYNVLEFLFRIDNLTMAWNRNLAYFYLSMLQILVILTLCLMFHG